VGGRHVEIEDRGQPLELSHVHVTAHRREAGEGAGSFAQREDPLEQRQPAGHRRHDGRRLDGSGAIEDAGFGERECELDGEERVPGRSIGDDGEHRVVERASDHACDERSDVLGRHAGEGDLFEAAVLPKTVEQLGEAGRRVGEVAA
jgi:hypothetical protein